MKTKTRRLLQPLWNAFERSLGAAPVLLCVSGGADSRALLESIALWPKRHAGIGVISIDHRVRSESLAESEYIKARARALGFDADCFSIPRTERFNEAVLRQERYRVIWKEAERLGIQSIALAHTQDDLAEGMLMDLMGVGGGAEGSAMPEIAQQDRGRVLRPLLRFSRSYLIAVLTELDQLDYFEDPTNDEPVANRVKVREFLKIHPYPSKRLAKLSERRRLENEALDHWALDLIQERSAKTVTIRNEPRIPMAVRIRSVKRALQLLMEGQDFRSSLPVIEQAISKEKGHFDLPGVCLQLSPGTVFIERK
ncbi:MAG: tRNA lysidine(34) synthetase TilS [Myxococcaceae bacterium]|nr:tRNA lysidine(34) synthetase TilS [Myxococcaceae bacterium]MBH2005904.1 tRNA lysidine(34) synthetase TilS [Myxococcaceae bacterium]